MEQYFGGRRVRASFVDVGLAFNSSDVSLTNIKVGIFGEGICFTLGRMQIVSYIL